MVPIKNPNEYESFLVTKHSWKGKYKRILSISVTGVSTLNPDRFFEITNKWIWSDVIGVTPNKQLNSINEFNLIVKKDRKTDTIRLSSEFRNDIITSILKYCKEFADKPKQIQVINYIKKFVCINKFEIFKFLEISST